jgi:hypothetical protein
MIKKFNIVNDPFIGTRELEDLDGCGLIKVSSEYDLFSKEFIERISQYIRFIQSDTPIDWPDKMDKEPEFLIIFSSNYTSYAYKVTFNLVGKIISENLYKISFYPSTKFESLIAVRLGEIQAKESISQHIITEKRFRELENMIPKTPYQTCIIKEIEEFRSIMQEIGENKLLVPEEINLDTSLETGISESSREEAKEFLKKELGPDQYNSPIFIAYANFFLLARRGIASLICPVKEERRDVMRLVWKAIKGCGYDYKSQIIATNDCGDNAAKVKLIKIH